MIRTIVALCFVFAVASARVTPVRQCANTVATGTIANVDVEPCDADRCVFKAKTKYTIIGELTTNITAEKPIIVAEVEVDGKYFEYPSIYESACEYLSCPLKADASNKFTIELITIDWLPPMDTKVQFHVYESASPYEEEELACIEADIAIFAAQNDY